MFDLFHVGDADLDRTNLRSLKDPVESAREDRSLELHPALRGDFSVKQGFSFRFYVGSASAEVTVDRYFPLNVLHQASRPPGIDEYQMSGAARLGDRSRRALRKLFRRIH